MKLATGFFLFLALAPSLTPSAFAGQIFLSTAVDVYTYSFSNYQPLIDKVSKRAQDEAMKKCSLVYSDCSLISTDLATSGDEVHAFAVGAAAYGAKAKVNVEIER